MTMIRKAAAGKLAVFLASILVSTAAYAGVYYVSGASGNDSNPGTSASPWKTISKAAGSLAAGDTVVVKAGTYAERVTISRSGTASSAISYTVDGAVTCRGFTIRAGFVVVDGFTANAEDNDSTAGRGFCVSGANVTVKNCYVTECPWGGIFYDNNSSKGTISHNRCYHNGQNGIEVWGSNHLVEANEIWESVQYHPQGGPPASWSPDADGVRFHGDHHTFRANWIHEPALKNDPGNKNPHIDCFQTYDAASSGKPAASYCTFERNHCRHYVSGMFTFMIEGSASHPAHHITIKNNLFEVGWGVNCPSGYSTHDVYVYNNTFIGDPSLTTSWPLAIDMRGISTGAVKNNITVNYKGNGEHRYIINCTGVTVDYNCAYNTDGSSPSGDPSRQLHELWAKDPKVLNFPGRDFHLQSGSPCIDSGAIVSEVAEDYEGNRRPAGGGFDIGAFEYAATGPSTTLRVASPNGGEAWFRGSVFDVGWAASNLTGNVTIDLYKGGAFSRTIGSAPASSERVDSLSGTSTLSWTIPSDVVAGGDYRIRVYQGSVEDYSDNVFAITAPVAPVIRVISPNGGESGIPDSVMNIAWAASSLTGNLTIGLYKGGVLTMTIGSAPASSGTFSWTVPSSVVTGGDYQIRIYQGSVEDYSDSVFSISSPVEGRAVITLSKSRLNFGSVINGGTTASQAVRVGSAGPGTLRWIAETPHTWIHVAPKEGTGTGAFRVSVDPAGLPAGRLTGSISVSDPGASNSPQTISVNLTVYSRGMSSPAVGGFDTPADASSGFAGAVPVAGWAVDDIEVTKVDLWRDPADGEPTDSNGYVFLGDADLIEDARPDIEQDHPDRPLHTRAGWGLMVRTQGFPHGGNGFSRLHAFAHDKEGNVAYLGATTISCDNAHTALPFGSIETPARGETISGDAYPISGWALTPRPKMIPSGGSAIRIWVDGQAVGHPFYDFYRKDIATLFPGYANSNGALGYYYLDTRGYENGIHALAWSVRDSGGSCTGIGTCYFSVANAEFLGPDRSDPPVSSRYVDGPSDGPDSVSRSSIRLKKGFDPEAAVVVIPLDDETAAETEIRETERLEVKLDPAVRYRGCLVVGEDVRPLPIGSTLDATTGTFSWTPGPGFLGTYHLQFVAARGFDSPRKISLVVTIQPGS